MNKPEIIDNDTYFYLVELLRRINDKQEDRNEANRILDIFDSPGNNTFRKLRGDSDCITGVITELKKRMGR